MLVYGLNSSGKTSCLRAIGVNLIMAQCGLYTACKKLVYYPFDTIISQIDLSDNLFAGFSSFVSEMHALKKILNCANQNTLVLGDELCKGTENYSATSIVASTILKLSECNVKFFLTSHLHDIPKINDIQNLKTLNICHLSVSTKNGILVFDRKLKPGSGSDLYGLEVAKNILQDSNFIDKAFEIRSDLTKSKKKATSIKKSRYNSKKIIDKCELCNSTQKLETDHIIPQETADENGFLEDSRHKNHISNLCVLCHECHLKKTQNKITINGYKNGLNGKFLDYN
jgi:DNA mismatch repair protein MutS